MSWLQALLLGLVQGLTEFLPVSSSGHLTLVQTLLDIQFREGDMVLFDVIVHAATVLSTIVVLWSEISGLLKGVFLTPKWNDEKTYAFNICLSMIPVFIVGVFFKDQVEAIFGSGIVLVGCCLLVTALLLFFADSYHPSRTEKITWYEAIIIGIAQAVAVLPGLSRSGTTIATGLILGIKKETVAQFSFLMVLVPILGEALLSVKDLLTGEVVSLLPVTSMVVGFVSAFLSGCFACAVMLNAVKQGKLLWFAIYCLIVGVIAIGCGFS